MWDPTPDQEAAAALGETLRGLGYDEEAIEDRLGEEAVAAEAGEALVHALRLDDDELGDAIRLLLLARPVARSSFAASAELVRLGLATEDGSLLVPRARIVPTESVYLTFDTFSNGDDDPSGWVASFTPTAYWLASLTPRRRVHRALDIGTGNGVHALLAAAHADEVIATDVNPRALAFTRISAALNGLDNVETRLGSLFEPVAAETFGLITCNAPYVISPKARWQYRDAGFPGDDFSRLVVTSAAAHLEDDGFASVLVSWLAASEDDPDEHVHEWLEGNGCDAWIIGLAGSDPVDHAAGWNDHLSSDPDAYTAEIDDWTSYFEALGAGWISEGGVVMHKRAGDRHVVRADGVDEDELEFASDQIDRVFTALAAIARDGDAVLDGRLRLVEETRFDQELDRAGTVTSTLLVLDEGTCTDWELTVEEADVLVALDGATTLDQAVARVARREDLSKREAAELRRDIRDLARDLLEVGALELT
ncbi:MAG TPA: methyltransferase [Gaiellaceae bacterium]|jgi:methylase of polypeptide subunit release factors